MLASDDPSDKGPAGSGPPAGSGTRGSRSHAGHGPTVLHDDAASRTVARHATDLSEHSVQDIP